MMKRRLTVYLVLTALACASLAGAAGMPCPPRPRDRWRVNFSRVQWRHNFEGKTAPKPPQKPINDSYRQTPEQAAQPPLPAYEKTAGRPEDNWVWTPEWQIDMHDPRWWGRVKFVKK